MTLIAGKRSYVGLAKQAAAGTASVTATIHVPTEDFPDIKTAPANFYSKEFRGVYAENTKVYRKPALQSAGTVSASAYNDFVTYALYGVMGAPATSGDAEGYTHLFTAKEALPIFTMFTGLDGTLNQEKFPDVTFKSIKFSAAPGEDVKVAVEMSGAPGDLATAAATPTYTTLRPLNHGDTSIKIATVANCMIESFEINIDRGIQEKKTFCATGLSSWYNNKVYPTTINCEGSFVMYFETYGEYEYWLGATGATAMATDAYDQDAADRALEITMVGEEIKSGGAATKDTIVITLPSILYDDANIERPYDDVVKVTFNFKAIHNATAETAVAGSGTAKVSVISQVADPTA